MITLVRPDKYCNGHMTLGTTFPKPRLIYVEEGLASPHWDIDPTVLKLQTDRNLGDERIW